MLTHPSRRTVITHLGLAGAALPLMRIPAWALPQSWLTANETVIPFTDVPENFTTRRGDVASRIDLRELRTAITPNDAYFVVQHYNRPAIEAAAFKLDMRGLMGKPRTLTLDDIRRRPRVERTTTFECGGNQARGSFHGMVGNATWAGTPLQDLLKEAAPAGHAREVVFWGADAGKETLRGADYEMHFARSLALEDAMNAGAILAYEMNGQPLPVEHGFPLRVVVPGWYGVNNVKWVTGIELIDTRFAGRFMGRDYVTIMGRQVGDTVEYTETSVARQRIKSVVARVTRTPQGRMRVFGAAWSDGTPLKSVEVRLDQGNWQPAQLEPSSNPFAWTFFSLETAMLASGAHTVVSRATDRDGREQPASLELKKTFWEDNAQFTRAIAVA